MASRDFNLLDPGFLKKLERLRIVTRRAFPGATRGERRSTRRGSSVEFADFRKYEAGDDFRHVDWNIYARLERLMLRQFIEEEDVRVDVMLDASESMQFGEGITKLDFARRAAACLAFIAATSHDMAGLSVFGGARALQMPAKRGRAHLMSLLSFLDAMSREDRESQAENGEVQLARAYTIAAAPPDLAAILKRYNQRTARPGVVFIISDFLDASDFTRELKLLRYDGFDLNLIQVLALGELRPEIAGDYALVDSETGGLCEITIDRRALAAYRAKLDEFTAGLETFCRGKGIGYTLFNTSENFEDVLLRNLVQSRMTG